MIKEIPYGRQSIDQSDIEAVIAVLKSEFLTQGPVVPLFENAISSYCNVAYAVATNSATSALHISCLALGVGPGDLVWTSPITFVASANCALYCGANVDFVDIDSRTYNMDVSLLEKKLIAANKENRLPKVVIPVHLCGQSCDMEAIHRLSITYGFKIIEDASHAIGAKYQNESVGNCKYSDITVFSFHPVKIITTTEGGLATTNDPILANRMRLYRSHGITRNPEEMNQVPDGSFFYQQIELGYNYRMTDVQAALGLSQLKRLDKFVCRRHEIVNMYNSYLEKINVTIPFQNPDTYSSFHLYIIRVHDASRHKDIFESLRLDGILVNLHYIPVYRHEYYKRIGFNYSNFPEAEKYYSEAISLPIYYELTDEQVASVAKAIEKSLANKIS
jgi:UDP-4-amino-4,6-dideoxy-N-acetyl-beta-L-altrosamine transaminase